VLLVEDDASMREALARLLDAAGLSSTGFASAEALLAVGTSAGAICVVSDLKLPGMSGLELLVELRRQGGWPPLILVTAHDALGLREEAARRGASAYLAKPFQAAELLEAIERAAGAPRVAPMGPR
jgi:FixJ family two-component response regulator